MPHLRHAHQAHCDWRSEHPLLPHLSAIIVQPLLTACSAETAAPTTRNSSLSFTISSE
jgi:hypothetical protein